TMSRLILLTTLLAVTLSTLVLANYEHCPHHIIHKTKTVKIPYAVVKKVPELKVIKVPYKVPVKVPEYIPIKESKYEHKEHYGGHDEYGKHDEHYKKA